MSIRQKIEELLQRAVVTIEKEKKLDSFVIPKITARGNEDPRFGDYATTLPFQLAKPWRVGPFDAGELLIGALRKQVPKDFFIKLEVIKGFLNFTIHSDVYAKELKAILKTKTKYGDGAKRKKPKNSYSLDYLDANPTGPVHIGHARSGFYGDVLARVLKKAGHEVSREFYINNAKASGQIQSLGRTALGRGEEYKHDLMRSLLKKSSVKARLKKITNTFWQAQDRQEQEAGFFIASLIQKINKDFLKKKAKIEYDIFFEEERIYQKKLLDKTLGLLQQKGVIYEKDGALWFRASQFGDNEDRVFVRSTGQPTYVLPDIAYHLDRLVIRKFTYAIDMFGADHHGYGSRLKGALTAVGIDSDRVRIITMQTVRLMKGGKEFKMSKRKGIFVTLEELIDEAGLDATRFFFLAHSPDSHMDFDLNLAKKRSQKNPVYYVQYSYARIASILKKATSDKRPRYHPLAELRGWQATRNKKSKIHVSLLKEKEEQTLMRKLAQFPEIVEDTAEDYRVLRFTTYATELARAFHHFYEHCRIISDDAALSAARLTLVETTRIVLKNTLDLMGISAPEKM